MICTTELIVVAWCVLIAMELAVSVCVHLFNVPDGALPILTMTMHLSGFTVLMFDENDELRLTNMLCTDFTIAPKSTTYTSRIKSVPLMPE